MNIPDLAPARFRQFSNPATGESVQFTATPQDDGEDVVRFNWRSMPGGAITEHVHPHQEERFAISAGEAHFTLAGEQSVVGPGETLVVPIGVRHSESNPGSVAIEGVVELRPALHTKEMFEAFGGLGSEGKTTPRGAPKNPLQLGATLWYFRHESRATSPPIWAQNLILPPLAALAKTVRRAPLPRPLGQPGYPEIGARRMKIHALTTGAVRVKHSFLYPRHGWRRHLDLFLPGAFSDPLPIHCWAIEHDGVLRLVDTGETTAARNVPFARMEVTRDQELPAAIAAAGLELQDVSEVVLTHAHGDHIDGLVHVRGRVLIHETELEFLASPTARVMRRVLHQPLPPGFAPEPFTLGDGPFGAFARSRSLSDDRRIVAVDTPGHTPGHISVICVDDSGRHVMLAGDTTDSLEQLYALRADAVAPDPKVHIATMRTILAHCAAHPTIYLPSHDPDSAARFADATTSAPAPIPVA